MLKLFLSRFVSLCFLLLLLLFKICVYIERILPLKISSYFVVPGVVSYIENRKQKRLGLNTDVDVSKLANGEKQ